MPRPITELTDEQRRLLAVAVKSAKKARDTEDQAWTDAHAARVAGVPDTVLCEETGLSKSTLNRKYGPRG
ncbi:hypothetical protein [Actinoplanes italicus]|uniref:Uncharacterized protein n=2 Tax=Actinoplanes italicus TaxID=113567 RepID=A0A2T0KJJ9_9ACTN|nr:hypothetical protein [Actinoplanes italicus]PRX23694.1 hypothetical protein CLV67_103443 [Actinoplanes italicus]